MNISFMSRNGKIRYLSPARIIVFSFAVLILTGALLLSLPVASKNGQSAGFLTALFTSTSASCVTGLVVVDTLSQWSIFGQIVILILIQCGGLGIITLATFFSVLLGKKVSLRGMLLAQESINHFSFEGVLNLIKKVVIVTFAIELLGAILLSTSFVPKFGARGFYMGVFHSISAFCNAGFDIMGDFQSFTRYNDDPVVIYTIAGLIIIGGLGFMVWKDLYEFPKNKSLLLHTKVVLIITAFLILFGTLFFFTFEHNNPATTQNMSLFEKINASFFHSVVTRTAGFNSFQLDNMREVSKVATIILMFIGGAPGSTAGGIKVTTFGVIIFAVISQIKGLDDTIIFRKRVPHYIVNKSLAIIVLSLIWIISVTTITLAAEENKPFINMLYETTSAFGTVGLSIAPTPSLGTLSRLLIILTMFFGRVGPLSFAIALTLRSNKKSPSEIYPEGKIVVG